MSFAKGVGCCVSGPDHNHVLMGTPKKMNHKGKFKVDVIYADAADQ